LTASFGREILRIIDTHLHLVNLDRLRYPWLADLPKLQRNFPLEEYWRQAAPLGIDGALHMEVDVAEADIEAETDWVLGLGAPIVGVIAACRPEDTGFPGYLERAASEPRLRGLRRILHTSPDELGQRHVFAENLQRLAAHNLTFELCVLARQLPIAAAIARACPDVQFVLDHCGVPDVKGRALDPWRRAITDLAHLPNVACKISGVIAYVDPESWTTEDLRPFVEHCIAAFGWDRVVWGSDYPVCTLTANLGRWVAATHELIAGASAHEKEALLSRNAERIYRLA
jgi:predicted TIM-barrel fold metal-dependent hydrolase